MSVSSRDYLYQGAFFMSETIVIYGLYDPRTNDIRYIGKTSISLEERLQQHIGNAKGGTRTHKANWIRLLLSLKLEPYIKILGETTENAWQEDEKAWIAKAEGESAKLTNLTKGGDGLIGYHHSDGTIEKIRQANIESGKIPPNWKGRIQSPEHIRKRVEARQRAGNYGHTEESKENISKGRIGKNMGNTNSLGYKHTEEWKAAARKRSKGENNPSYGKSPSEETKNKMSQGRKGKNTGNQNAKGKICTNCAQKIKRQKRNSPIYVHRSDSQRECEGMSTFAE